MQMKTTTTPKPIQVTDSSFEQEVLKSSLPVLMECWAPWCGPCRKMAPVVDELAAALSGATKVAKLNVDENPGIASRFGIQSIPTLLLFRNGQVLDKFIGVTPRAKIEADLRRHSRDR